MRRSGGFGYYAGYFLGWTLAIVAGGAVVGAVAFPLAGALFDIEGSAAELAASGARKLAFLAFVWAPGTAIVLCFHRAYRDRKAAGAGVDREAPAGNRPAGTALGSSRAGKRLP